MGDYLISASTGSKLSLMCQTKQRLVNKEKKLSNEELVQDLDG